jgi:predicted unusual protein kinase regulating ubiquinone biosynthesis (AarF/ABC1/UbiB family)
MLDLYQAIYTKQKNQKFEDFVSLSAIFEDVDLDEMDDQARKSCEDRYAKELIEIADTEVKEFAKEHGDTITTHWNMLKKSGFKEELWNKFEDITLFLDGVLKMYFSQKIENLTVKFK